MVRLATRRLLSCALVIAASAGCDPTSEASAMQKVTPPKAKPAIPASPEPLVAPKPTPTPLTAGQTISIAAGKVYLGSLPGTVDRDPSREADQVAVDVAAFSIDRLPYPNDPALPPLTHVSRDEAAQKCSEAGKRLCSEIEWERACEGDDDQTFPGAEVWGAAACADDRVLCDSSFGVSELGLKVREWTASDAPQGLGVNVRTAVTRGSSRDAAASEHRCSARNAATPDSRSESIGFRCCAGSSNEQAYPVEAARPLVQPSTLSKDAVREILQSVPELAPYAETFTPLNGADVSRALARGKRSADGITLWTMAPGVFTWSPMQGEEILVIAGHVRGSDGSAANEDSVLLSALYPHRSVGPDGAHVATQWIHGVSTLLADKDSSIAIGYRSDEPGSLLWTSCWGCYGEGGRMSLVNGRVGLQFH